MLVAFILGSNPWKGFKYIYYLHIPLGILATYGLFEVVEKITSNKTYLKNKVTKIILAILIIGSLVSISERAININSEKYHSLFMLKSEEKAIKFLAGQPKGNVLSSYYFANNLLWNAPHKNYFAHWSLSQVKENYNELKQNINDFYSPEVKTESKRKFLEQNSINYVVYGPRERKIGVIDSNLGLKLIYENDEIEIYQYVKV
ncbi:MAG: hypothetical protein QXU92_01195 [Candidatus Diapherotrites archaeon]